MSNIDLSRQILKKINSASKPKFKTISDIDVDSKFNMLQYAIYLTKYGDMQNLNEEECLYLLNNINFNTNSSSSNTYLPMDTMDLIYGVNQGQKIVLTIDFLNKLHTFHTKSIIFSRSYRPSLGLTLVRSLLDFPNIEPSCWMWLVEKNMKKSSIKDFSTPVVKKYLLDFCNNSKFSYLFKISNHMDYAQKSINYLMAASEREILNQEIKPQKSSLEFEQKKLIIKI